MQASTFALSSCAVVPLVFVATVFLARMRNGERAHRFGLALGALFVLALCYASLRPDQSLPVAGADRHAPTLMDPVGGEACRDRYELRA